MTNSISVSFFFIKCNFIMLNHIFFKVAGGFFLACFLVLSGCREELSTFNFDTVSADDKLIVDYLIACGFQKEDIEIGSDYYTLEEDMAIDREGLLLMVKNEFDSISLNSDAVSRQRAVSLNAAVSSAKVNVIKYFIHPSVNNCNNASTWLSAISSSVQNWTNITNCRVAFILTTQQSQADIIFSSDEPANSSWNLPATYIDLSTQYGSGTRAKGSLPSITSVGKPGKYISINRFSTATNRLTAMMHELGHNIGFHHSNQTSGTALFNTPDPDDNTSVMFGDASQNNSTAFNTGDIRAARLLYPDDLIAPASFSVTPGGSKKVNVTVSTPSSTKPPYWLSLERYSTSGVFLETLWAVHNGTTFTFASPSGTWKFKARRSNYKMDVFSPYTAFVTVTVQP